MFSAFKDWDTTLSAVLCGVGAVLSQVGLAELGAGIQSIAVILLGMFARGGASR